MKEQLKLKIADITYPLKFTLLSWKELKDNSGITIENFESKMKEDVQCLIDVAYYGIPKKDREGLEKETLAAEIDWAVLDTLMPAIMAGMPEQSRKLAEAMTKALDEKIDEASKNGSKVEINL